MKRGEIKKDNLKPLFSVDFRNDEFIDTMNNVKAVKNASKIGEIDQAKGLYCEITGNSKYLAMFDMIDTNFFQTFYNSEYVLLEAELTAYDWAGTYTWAVTYPWTWHTSTSDTPRDMQDPFKYPYSYSQGAPDACTVDYGTPFVFEANYFYEPETNICDIHVKTSNNQDYMDVSGTLSYKGQHRYIRILPAYYGNNTFFKGYVKTYKIWYQN